MVLANWPITCRMPPGQLRLHTLRLSALPFFRTLLEPRRRSERALLAVVQQAYVAGVSKSQVSRICQELDGVVESFLGRPLDA